MENKRRLDIELARRGLCASRSRARDLICGGNVLLNGDLAQKPAILCAESDEIAIQGGNDFVGRGGIKLEHALSEFSIDVSGKNVLDIGASTGGFVHCLLLSGAARVFAVDVGTGQLDERLRRDERVVSMEGRDARSLCLQDFDAGIDLIVCDVSFISLFHILPKVCELLPESGHAVLLVKPQFEAGRARVGKRGIVKDKSVHTDILLSLADGVKLVGFTVLGITGSPIRGGSGNIEFFIHIARQGEPWRGSIRETVDAAHKLTAGGGK